MDDRVGWHRYGGDAVEAVVAMVDQPRTPGLREAPPTNSFAVLVPLRVRVGDEVLDLGQVRAELQDPELVGEATGPEGGTLHRCETPDRRVA